MGPTAKDDTSQSDENVRVSVLTRGLVGASATVRAGAPRAPRSVGAWVTSAVVTTGVAVHRWPGEAPPEDKRDIFVTNLAWEATPTEVRSFFAQCGTICAFRMPKPEVGPSLHLHPVPTAPPTHRPVCAAYAGSVGLCYMSFVWDRTEMEHGRGIERPNASVSSRWL